MEESRHATKALKHVQQLNGAYGFGHHVVVPCISAHVP